MRYMTITKNLFGYSSINIASDMANGTIVESLPNGAIVQGDVGSDPGRNNYSNGWFGPGNTPDGPVIKPHLLAGDTVTISCDYLILERNYAFLTDVGIYLNDDSHGFSDVVIFGLEVGKQYRLTATYTVDIEGDYYPILTINSNKTKVTNIQIEKGSTATPYVPYGYLPMYKGRYKVSDACQLLDKSTYSATQTIKGVTFTNNGDGTITANGTSTSDTYSSFRVNTADDVPAIKGHIYCVLGCPSGGSSKTYDCNTSWGTDRGNGNIELKNGDIGTGNYYIRIFAGYTANNLVFKPQVLDLTEMFGAGNEPTTVAEFKEKFPDDLYPYSPYCWAKIKSLIYKDNIDYIKMK